jgi:aryl carrier-like protein
MVASMTDDYALDTAIANAVACTGDALAHHHDPIGDGLDHARTIRSLRWARADIDLALTHLVAAMRAEGRSWNTIADALGVTRQGAQKRYDSATAGLEGKGP